MYFPLRVLSTDSEEKTETRRENVARKDAPGVFFTEEAKGGRDGKL